MKEILDYSLSRDEELVRHLVRLLGSYSACLRSSERLIYNYIHSTSINTYIFHFYRIAIFSSFYHVPQFYFIYEK